MGGGYSVGQGRYRTFKSSDSTRGCRLGELVKEERIIRLKLEHACALNVDWEETSCHSPGHGWSSSCYFADYWLSRIKKYQAALLSFSAMFGMRYYLCTNAKILVLSISFRVNEEPYRIPEGARVCPKSHVLVVLFSVVQVGGGWNSFTGTSHRDPWEKAGLLSSCLLRLRVSLLCCARHWCFYLPGGLWDRMWQHVL